MIRLLCERQVRLHLRTGGRPSSSTCRALRGRPRLALIGVGIHQSIEFTGGTLVQFKTTAPVDVEKLRAGLDAAGIKGAEIQRFGGDNEYVVRARTAVEGTKTDDTQATDEGRQRRDRGRRRRR